MVRENRFNSEDLEKARKKNYKIVTDMAVKLNNLKGYTTAYTNPQKGKMIVDFNGQLYIMDLEPIETLGENTLQQAMKEYGFMFKDEVK